MERRKKRIWLIRIISLEYANWIIFISIRVYSIIKLKLRGFLPSYLSLAPSLSGPAQPVDRLNSFMANATINNWFMEYASLLFLSPYGLYHIIFNQAHARCIHIIWLIRLMAIFTFFCTISFASKAKWMDREESRTHTRAAERSKDILRFDFETIKWKKHSSHCHGNTRRITCWIRFEQIKKESSEKREKQHFISFIFHRVRSLW